MRKFPHLSQRARDEMLSTLHTDQRNFLDGFLKRGKRTVFANVLAKEKAGDSSHAEDFAEQWELLDYIDAGPQWRTESSLFCECGRQLRLQYVIENKKTHELKRFGITHFEEHTGIPAYLALQIKNGMASIDYELDEILIKINEDWCLADEGIRNLSNEIDIPSTIQQHLDLAIPLLDRQLVRLKALIVAAEAKERVKKEVKQRVKEAQLESAWQSELVDRKEELVNSDWWTGVQGTTDLELDWQLSVILYMKEIRKEEVLASEITNGIVKRYGAPRDTYPTGKFKIYPYVCLFLGHLTIRNKVKLVEKKVNMDRVYQVLDPFLLDNKNFS